MTYIGVLLYFVSFSQLIPKEDFTQYTIEDGLPSNFVYAVEQDDRGYIWIATDAGVSRFDGYEFKNYTLADGLPDTEIINFFKDSKGRIWLYALNGKAAFIYEDSIYDSENIPKLSPLNAGARPTSIAEWNSELYFTAMGKIRIFKEDSSVWTLETTDQVTPLVVANHSTNELHALSTTDSKIDSNQLTFHAESSIGALGLSHCIYANNVFIAHKERTDTLVFYNSETKSHYYRKLSENVKSYNIIKSKGQVFLTTSIGIYKIDTLSLTPIYYTNIPETSNAFQDLQGNLWASSIKSGLFFKKERKINFSPEFENIGRLFNINNKVLIVQHKDIHFSRKRVTDPFEKFLTVPTLPEPVLEILPYGDDYLILTSDQLITTGPRATYQKLQVSDMAISVGHIYVATYDGDVVKIHTRDTLRNNNSNQLLTSKLDSKGLIHRHKRAKVRNGAIREIQVSEGYIWAGSEQGLFVSRIADQMYFKQVPEIPPTRIWDLAVISADSVIVGTGGAGIIAKFGKERIQITKNDGLLSNICRRIELVDSTLWVTSNKGLNQIIFKKSGEFKVYSITQNDGLPLNEVNDLVWFKDTLYISTGDRLAYFHQNTSFEESSDYPVYIQSIDIDGYRINELSENEFHHETEIVKLKFLALNYSNTANLKYAYRLNQAEDESPWIETSEREATFINLKPGTYHFEVRTKTKNSRWTKTTRLPFSITPPFWLTIWFQITLIVLSIIIGYMGYQRATRNRRLRAKFDAERVEAQLQVLRAQINPHFLFNALNSIKRFILKNENDAAEAYLTKYSHHIRDILHFSRKLTLSIHQEITLIERYVEIEKIRTGDSFQFIIDIDKNIDQYATFIPTMVIQPFVENAIWHGIMQEKLGRISLSFTKLDDKIQISLIDNGVGFNSSMQEDSNSLGISLVRERIRLIGVHYKSKTNLEVLSRPGEGTEVRILIPADLV